MAINPCKECGAPVSTTADKCQRCGAKVSKEFSPIIVIAVVLFAGYFANSYVSSKDSISNSTAANTRVDSATNMLPVAISSPWIYKDSTDDMRAISTKFALNISVNSADFDFPYSGGSTLNLALRKVGKDNSDVIFGISKGQFLCKSYDGCSAAVKFGDSAIKNVKLAESETHSSDTLFISSNKDANWFIEQLKTNKVVTVELLFYQEGSRQFKFNTEKLNW